MIKLKFFGGVNEVGGNKIMLQVEDTRIFLDFGISFEQRRLFYSEPFFSPSSYKELIEFSLLPKINGFYKEDSLEDKRIDGVFISHAHRDHWGFIPRIREDIPVFCGECTKLIIKTQQEISNIDSFKKRENFSCFRSFERIKIKSIQIEPIHVDHSIPASYGFIIYTPFGNVVYTGDFRLSGSRSDLSWDFIKKIQKEGCSILISEGTNIEEGECLTEEELLDKLISLIKKTEGIVITQFSYSDIDRLRTYYTAAKETERVLVLTARCAYLLFMLQKDPKIKLPQIEDENIFIFKKEKKQYYTWESSLFSLSPWQVISAREIKEMGKRVILLLPFYDIQELLEILPPKGSLFILSQSEPYNEEMEVDFERLRRWLAHFGLPLYFLHVSGHIMPIELKEVIKAIKPKIVFPIHTPNQILFKNFIEDDKIKVEIIQEGKEYLLWG